MGFTAFDSLVISSMRTPDFLRAQLADMIDLRHPLAVLATGMNTSIPVTRKSGLVVGARTFPGNP